jgi:GMP synthase-like glutamine amidotransferase
MAWTGDLPSRGSFDRLVVMGGPMGVHDERAHPWLVPEKHLISEAIAGETGVLGVCLGAQLVADVLGAEVNCAPEREIGWFPVVRAEIDRASALGLPARFDAFHWHADAFTIPEGTNRLAASEACENQAFASGDGRVVGLQFHLESTPDGVEALLRECAEDYAEPGRFVQTPDEIAGVESGYARANALLFNLLDLFAGAR